MRTPASVAQGLGRFELAWRQAEKSGARAAQVRLAFESLRYKSVNIINP